MTRNKLLLALPAVAMVAATTAVAAPQPASAQVYYTTPVYDDYGTSYVDPYYSDYTTRNPVSSTVGGALLGAGVGALGGLAVGALTGGRHRGWGPYGYGYGWGHRNSIGRDVGIGTAIGAGVGGGLGLLNGLFGGSRTVAAPGDYWY